MGWSVGTDLAAHRAAVAGFLGSDPVEHTTQATILDTLAGGVSWSDDPPVFGVHRDPSGRVDAAAVTTPPHPLVLDGPVEHAKGLAAALGEQPLAGVNASEPVAASFATAWCAPRGCVARRHLRLHLLALPSPEALREPGPTAGVVRRATTADLDAVSELVAAMRVELGEHGTSPVQMVRDRIATGLVRVLDHGGELVATAQVSAAVAGVSRVAGVYTRPAARGHGYAAAVTAAVTRAAYAAGATAVCLFTDAANPTSNGVYERLGYVRRPDDRVVLRFEPR